MSDTRVFTLRDLLALEEGLPPELRVNQDEFAGCLEEMYAEPCLGPARVIDGRLYVTCSVCAYTPWYASDGTWDPDPEKFNMLVEYETFLQLPRDNRRRQALIVDGRTFGALVQPPMPQQVRWVTPEMERDAQALAAGEAMLRSFAADRELPFGGEQ